MEALRAVAKAGQNEYRKSIMNNRICALPARYSA